MRIGDDFRELFLHSVVNKSGRELKAIIDDYHQRTGISVGHLYRLAGEVRFNDRASRSDAGKRKIDLTQEQLDFCMDLTIKDDFSAEHAIEVAELNGIIEKGKVSPAYYNALLREIGITRDRLKKDVGPASSWGAKGPNIIHEFDTTKLEQLHINKDDVLTWDPRANRKNSRGEKPDEIWLYSLIDKFSRAKYAFLYRSLNQYNHLDFFYRAWSEKPAPAEFPFFGLPTHIYMDKGGGNYALKVLTALRKLGVHLIPTTPSTSEPHGARKHGGIENVFKSYGEWLKNFHRRAHTWQEAQESLYCYVLKLNRRVHSVTGAAPFQRWLAIGTPQHTPSEELYRLFRYDHSTRYVSAYLTFTIDRHVYKLPEKRPYNNWVKERIEVYWEPGHYETVFAVHNSKEIELKECTDNLVRPAFSYPREKPDLTNVDAARAAANARPGDENIKLWETDRRAASYMPREGQDFDKERISQKSVETESGRRWSFAAEHWMDRFEAWNYLKGEEFFEIDDSLPGVQKKQQKDANIAWLRALLNDRGMVSETALKDAMILARARRENEAATEG